MVVELRMNARHLSALARRENKKGLPAQTGSPSLKFVLPYGSFVMFWA